MSYLYVTEPDTVVRIKDRQIIAERKNGLKVLLPLEKLEGVVVFGNAKITTGCSVKLLERGLPVTYLSGKGLFYGRLESTKHINIERQRNQFRCGDDEEFCVQMARKFISAKIHNQSVVLRRYNRNKSQHKVKEIIQFINEMKNKIELAGSIEQVMGYEGVASRNFLRE